MILSLYNYRQFVIRSIKDNLIHQFAASKLGGIWSILNPLSQALIYALILSNIMHAKLGSSTNKYTYSIYLLSGILGWNLFNDIIMQAMNIYVNNANLLKKVNFPRICLPIITVGSCMINNLFLFITMLIIFTILGHPLTLQLLWYPVLILLTAVFAIGLGLILGVINVFIRDTSQFIPIILQVTFWFTPIVYPATIIPARFRHLIEINPLYSIITSYHQILTYGKAPALLPIGIIFIISLVLCFLALQLNRRASSDMVEVL